jgi:hypothetical protein
MTDETGPLLDRPPTAEQLPVQTDSIEVVVPVRHRRRPDVALGWARMGKAMRDIVLISERPELAQRHPFLLLALSGLTGGIAVGLLALGWVVTR